MIRLKIIVGKIDFVREKNKQYLAHAKPSQKSIYSEPNMAGVSRNVDQLLQIT